MGRKKKVLYYSVHEVLEYDDLRILTRAGYDVCSIGSFFLPETRGNRFRTSKEGFGDQADVDAGHGGGMFHNADGNLCLTLDFVKRFDIAIINHDPDMIVRNIEALQQIPIVYRSIGQATLAIEVHLRQVADKVITCRYDPRETHPDYLKTDAVIRFGKYLDEYPRWEGSGTFLLTFMNNIRREPARPLFADYLSVVAGRELKIHGMQNEGVANEGGIVSPELQMQLYRDCQAYVYVNSIIASYTLNFIEALAVGAPIIAPSARFTATPSYPDWWPERYAIEEMLGGNAGLIYDNIDDAKSLIATLSSRDLKEISKRASARAHELFDARMIEGQWRSLIEQYT